MKYKYLIQTRSTNNQRNAFESIINSAGNAKDWKNYIHQYEELESAKNEAKLLIQQGSFKARDVRIVEIICTFNSEIKVEEQTP